MKINRLIIILFILFPMITNAVDIKLLKALEQVESNGKILSIGDHGKAYGCLQIWKVVILDVNRISKSNFKHKDAFNRKKAFKIAEIYLNYWGKIYEKRTGKKVTNEVYARVWNGGCYGWKKKSTIKYWNKVKGKLKCQN